MINFDEMIFPKDEELSDKCKIMMQDFIDEAMESVIANFSVLLLDSQDVTASFDTIGGMFPEKFDLPETYLSMLTILTSVNLCESEYDIDIMSHYILNKILTNLKVYGKNNMKVSKIKLPKDFRKQIKNALISDIKQEQESSNKANNNTKKLNDIEITDKAESIVKSYENYSEWGKYISGENPDWMDTDWYWNDDEKSILMKERLDVDTTYIDMRKTFLEAENTFD